MSKIHLDFQYPYWVTISCDFNLMQQLKTFVGCQFVMQECIWRFHICYLHIFIKEVYKSVLAASITYSELLNTEFNKYQEHIKHLEVLKTTNYDVDNTHTYFKRNKGLKLTNAQLQGANWLVNAKKGILAFDVGVGKTFTSLEAASIINNGGKKKVIIITLATLIGQWKSEIESQYDIKCFSIKEFKKQKIDKSGNVISERTVVPNAEERKMMYKQFIESDKFSALIINYELVRIDFNELAKCKFDIAIIDEASKLKSTTSFNVTDKVRRLNNRASIRELLKETPYVIGLTATPFETFLTNLLGIFNVINPDYFSGGSGRFYNRYMKQDRFGGWTIINKANFEEIKELVKPYMFFKKQELNIKVNIHKIDLQFTEKDLQLYDQIVDDVTDYMMTQIHKRSNETDNEYLERLNEAIMMSVTNKRYQFVDFPQIVYPGNYSETYVSPKAQWLIDNLPKMQGKVIIFDSRTKTTDILCKILQRCKMKYYIVDGEISIKDRNVILQRFREEEDAKILVCSDCLSYGVNLQDANVIVNLNLLYNPSAIQQRQGRIIRKGQKNDVNIYFLEMKDTFEEKIYEKLDYRSQVASNLFDDDFLKKKKRQINKHKMLQMICEKGRV